MKTPIESLQALLAPDEYEHLAGMIAAAPLRSVVSRWVDRLSAAVIVVKIDDEVASHLSVYASGAREGKEIAADIAANLANAYAATRDAREATRLLLRRLAH